MLVTARSGRSVASWSNPTNFIVSGTTTVLSAAVLPDDGAAPSIVYG